MVSLLRLENLSKLGKNMLENLLDNPWFVMELAITIGIVFRTLLPWIQKKAEGQELPFEPRYIWMAVFAWMTVQVEMATLLMNGPEDIVGTLPIKAAALIGFFVGLGNNEMWNRIFPAASTPKVTTPAVTLSQDDVKTIVAEAIKQLKAELAGTTPP